jgi:hypothetical protein
MAPGSISRLVGRLKALVVLFRQAVEDEVTPILVGDFVRGEDFSRRNLHPRLRGRHQNACDCSQSHVIVEQPSKSPVFRPYLR